MMTLIVLSIWSGVAFAVPPTPATSAVEVLKLRFRVHVQYEDSEYICDTGRLGADLFMNGSIEKGELRSLAIANFPREKVYQPIYKELGLPLSATQQSVTKIGGKWWLSSLLVSESVLKWILNTGLARHSSCALRKGIVSANSKLPYVKFELDGPDLGVEVSYSEIFKISGLREDKLPYEAKIRFVQRTPAKSSEMFPELNPWSK